MKTTMARMLVIVWTLAWIPAGSAGEMRTVVYPVVFGDIDALETYARTVVAEDGHVVPDAGGRRLIIVTTDEKHGQLNDVLGQTDARAGNVRIEVRFRETGTERDTGIGVRGAGEVVLGPGGTEGTVVLRPELRHTVTDTAGDTRQIIMAASGREAVLRVGERVPYIDWIMDYGWHGGYIRSRVEWQEVGSFLVVTPTILPDGSTVHVRLTPELRGRVDGHPHHTRFTGLATEVTVRDGNTLRIGGSAEDQEFYSRFLIGIDRSGVRRSLDIELTPQIVHTH